MPTPKQSRSSAPVEPLRFAHPFFTRATRELRPDRSDGSGDEPRLLDHIKAHLEPIPIPRRNGIMTLAGLIGEKAAQAIAATGTLKFHTTGDTGLPPGPTENAQELVAQAMTSDYDVNQPATCPGFFLHLGDVVYGPNKSPNYRGQFYEPYLHYPGKIVAVAGNHDGETFSATDPKSLEAFLANFCAPRAVVPAIAGSIFRQTMTQPGVYWRLDAPFVQIIGLYSNVAENPGFIAGTLPGQHQKQWLISTLKSIAKTRAAGHRHSLVFAAHHPPFSSGGHSGSAEMLSDIDDACQQAGIMPDLFLSGHAHSYQRYTRKMIFQGRAVEIPFLVVGCGGHGGQFVPSASGQRTGDRVFEASYHGHGYALVSATKTKLSVQFLAVEGREKRVADKVTIKLAN